MMRGGSIHPDRDQPQERADERAVVAPHEADRARLAGFGFGPRRESDADLTRKRVARIGDDLSLNEAVPAPTSFDAAHG